MRSPPRDQTIMCIDLAEMDEDEPCLPSAIECIDLTAMDEDQAYLVGAFIMQQPPIVRLPKHTIFTLHSPEQDIAVSFTFMQKVVSHRLVKDETQIGCKVIGEKQLGKGKYGSVWVVLGSLYFDANDDNRAVFEANHSLAVKIIKQEFNDRCDYFCGRVSREVNFSRQVGKTNYLHFKKPTFFPNRKNKLNKNNDKLLSAYIIMKRLHGETLQTYLILKHLTTAQIVMLSALLPRLLQEDCHDKFIQHRDIKPDNIMINFAADGSIIGLRFIDFGLAKDWRFEDFKLCGSPMYMAPELILHQSSDGRADINSLGKVLVVLYGLGLPFDANVGKDVIMRISTDDDLKISTTPEFKKLDIGRENRNKIVNMLQRMTRKSPDERPSLAEVITFFEEIAASLKLQPHVTLSRLNQGFFSRVDVARSEESASQKKLNISMEC